MDDVADPVYPDPRTNPEPVHTRRTDRTWRTQSDRRCRIRWDRQSDRHCGDYIILINWKKEQKHKNMIV
jgi:hypothetical protein